MCVCKCVYVYMKLFFVWLNNVYPGHTEMTGPLIKSVEDGGESISGKGTNINGKQ